MPRPVTFWFEFASTYSYLSAMRIDVEAEARGVEVVWKPFLLGPIFKAQGWDSSPFSIYPDKGANMWRDLARRAEKYGLPFNRAAEKLFPQHSVLAARVAIVGLQASWGRAYCRAVYQAQFVEGRDISDRAVIAACIDAAGGMADDALARAERDTAKAALRANVEDARSRRVYGAPSFIVDDELFWGDDRLEDALDWANRD